MPDRARLSPWVLLLLVLASLLVAAGCSPPFVGARPATAATATPEGVEHTERFLTAKGDTQLYTQAWRPTQTPKGVLIVVHGLKDHGSRYQELAVRLAQQGIAVHALDLRGHAHSSGVRVYVDSFNDYLDDLDVLVAAVREQEKRYDYFLFGHSMGGAISTLYTLERGGAPRGLILSAAALQTDVSGVKVFGTKAVETISPKAGVFQLDLDKFSRDKAVVADCRRDPFVYQDGAPARTARELLSAIDRIGSSMPSMNAPLLVLHGTADEVTPPSGSKKLVEVAHSQDKTLKLYEGYYHDLLHEPDHGLVVDDIADWIQARAEAPVR